MPQWTAASLLRMCSQVLVGRKHKSRPALVTRSGSGPSALPQSGSVSSFALLYMCTQHVWDERGLCMLSSQPQDRVEACGRLPCVLAFGAARGCLFVFWRLLTALRDMSRCGGCWMAHCVDVRLHQRFCTSSNGCLPRDFWSY